MDDPKADENRLAFVDIFVFPDGSIRGGVLTTDNETRPYEFRVTTAIKPTQLQTILYGNLLSEYIYGELICLPLIKASKERLSLVLVKNENLLIVRPEIQIPMVLVRNQNLQSNIQSVTGNPSSITINTHPSFPGEKDWASTQLFNLNQRHDVLEPFERLRLAVNEISKIKS